MWAYETTFYQIYPLGFCGAPRENVAPVAEDELAQAANAAPNPDAPIIKIAQWADYLQKLGIGTGTAIGGAVVSGPGIAWIGFVGGAIAVVGVILAITVLFPAIRRAKPVA